MSVVNPLTAFILTFVLFLSTVSWAQSVPPITWGTNVNVSDTPGRPSSFTEVAATGDTVHVIWWDNDRWSQPGSLYYKRSFDGGATWRDLHVFTNALLVEMDIVTSGNKVIAVWRDLEGSQTIMRYARSTDAGLTWSSSQNLSPVGNVSYIAAAMGGGRTVVIWTEVSGTTASTKMRVSTDDGQTWSASMNVVTYNFDVNWGVSADMAIGSSAVVVCYREGSTPWIIRTVRSTDWGQTWSSPTLVSSDPSYCLTDLQLVVLPLSSYEVA